MKAAISELIPWERFSVHRGGDTNKQTNFFNQKYLLGAGSKPPHNYDLTLVEVKGKVPVPQHKHNFDQFRYMVSGEYAFDVPEHTVMHPGDVGYFPEGAAYGPEDQIDDPIILVLQFGGASGLGFMNQPDLKVGAARLKERGRFEKGKYFSDLPGADPEGVDGYEAVWEEVKGQSVVYPAPRYTAPLLMRSQAFLWNPVGDGVYEKALGRFDGDSLAVRLLKLKPGSRTRIGDKKTRTLAVVTQGKVRLADADLGHLNAVDLEGEPDVAFSHAGGKDGAELLLFTIPL